MTGGRMRNMNLKFFVGSHNFISSINIKNELLIRNERQTMIFYFVVLTVACWRPAFLSSTREKSGFKIALLNKFHSLKMCIIFRWFHFFFSLTNSSIKNIFFFACFIKSVNLYRGFKLWTWYWNGFDVDLVIECHERLTS